MHKVIQVAALSILRLPMFITHTQSSTGETSHLLEVQAHQLEDPWRRKILTAGFHHHSKVLPPGPPCLSLRLLHLKSSWLLWIMLMAATRFLEPMESTLPFTPTPRILSHGL